MHINDVQKRVHNPCFINHNHLIITKMEKSRSFPQYSSEFRYENGSDPYSFNGPSEKCRGFEASNDPEMKRKKRIAGYNMFTTEGKVKASFRESFKWIKTKINDVRYNI